MKRQWKHPYLWPAIFLLCSCIGISGIILVDRISEYLHRETTNVIALIPAESLILSEEKENESDKSKTTVVVETKKPENQEKSEKEDTLEKIEVVEEAEKTDSVEVVDQVEKLEVAEQQEQPEKGKRFSFKQELDSIVTAFSEGVAEILDKPKKTEKKQQIIVFNPSMEVSDATNVWETNTSVEIFRISYVNGQQVVTVASDDGDKVIAPGTGSSYSFMVHNNGNLTLDYSVAVSAFCTPSEYSVPIIGSLSSQGGGSSEIEPGEKVTYTYDWVWEYEGGDDVYDTLLGNVAAQEDIVYTVVITTTATSEYEPGAIIIEEEVEVEEEPEEEEPIEEDPTEEEPTEEDPTEEEPGEEEPTEEPEASGDTGSTEEPEAPIIPDQSEKEPIGEEPETPDTGEPSLPEEEEPDDPVEEEEPTPEEPEEAEPTISDGGKEDPEEEDTAVSPWTLLIIPLLIIWNLQEEMKEEIKEEKENEGDDQK